MPIEKSEPKDPIDEYDRQHGAGTSYADATESVPLNEGQNQPPPQYTPFKVK